MEIKKAISKITVTEDLTAQVVGSGDMPVFATPMMAALMENAAAKCAADLVEEGCTTVGVSLSISHIKATPLGMQVTAEAVLTEQDGRKLTFEVSAFDEQGEIGKGIHERVIVNREKFLAKAQNK